MSSADGIILILSAVIILKLRQKQEEGANVIIDQFGRDTALLPVDEEHFEVRVDMNYPEQCDTFVTIRVL